MGVTKKGYRHFSGIVFSDSAKDLTLYEKNTTLVEGIIDIFGFSKTQDIREIKRKVSREHVAELHKLMAWLWPPDTKASDFLPAPSNNLRGLYMGNMRPETILKSVGRYSLYCDEVLVMNPFMNPWFIAPDYNPLIHPEEYVGETWKWVIFVMKLAPWILDKQVILLPNPSDFDSKLRISTWESAEKRLAPQKNELRKLMERDEIITENSFEDFKRSWMSMPEDALKRNIVKSMPKMSKEEMEAMLKYINRMKEADPYFVTNPNENGAFGIQTFQSGGNLEQGMYIAQLTGAHLYTDLAFRWKEILSVENEPTKMSAWSPITHSFQKLDFKFLDNVDLKFVHRIKADGRLSNMRNFLRRTWDQISKEEATSFKQANKLALEFSDEMKERYLEAETEWDKINDDLQKWLIGRSGLGAILATGGIHWEIPALGFALEGVNRLLETRQERKSFKKKVPLSVFIDLKKKK